jgi:hypothetical protein
VLAWIWIDPWGFAYWAAMATCGLWNGLLHLRRVDDVNKLLPENQRFNTFRGGMRANISDLQTATVDCSLAARPGIANPSFRLASRAALISMAVDLAFPF